MATPQRFVPKPSLRRIGLKRSEDSKVPKDNRSLEQTLYLHGSEVAVEICSRASLGINHPVDVVITQLGRLDITRLILFLQKYAITKELKALPFVTGTLNKQDGVRSYLKMKLGTIANRPDGEGPSGGTSVRICAERDEDAKKLINQKYKVLVRYCRRLQRSALLEKLPISLRVYPTIHYETTVNGQIPDHSVHAMIMVLFQYPYGANQDFTRSSQASLHLAPAEIDRTLKTYFRVHADGFLRGDSGMDACGTPSAQDLDFQTIDPLQVDEIVDLLAENPEDLLGADGLPLTIEQVVDNYRYPAEIIEPGYLNVIKSVISTLFKRYRYAEQEELVPLSK